MNPTCPRCGGSNVEVEPEHEEGDRLLCFDCRSPVVRSHWCDLGKHERCTDPDSLCGCACHAEAKG